MIEEKQQYTSVPAFILKLYDILEEYVSNIPN